MDLRKEAEERALKAERAAVSETDRRSSFRVQQQSLQQLRRQSIRTELNVNEVDFSSQQNDTPKIAQLAEIDYKWNGSRAKNGGNFVLPRWVPDEEIMYCHACNGEFDYVNRKHHCRHCGMVYCDTCSSHRVLLPHEYGYKDPVRVCDDCFGKMEPLQQYLSTNIANHHRVNNIDIASANCNVRRYMNMPFSSTLGSEIRKAAYSTHNLFSQPLHFVRDKAIPLRFLATAKGLAFITVIKGGFIFAPRMGTGLVVSRLSESAGGGWSAPTAIASVGLSWGAVIGLDVTDYVIVLNTEEAVTAFSGLGQITIGAGIEVAVGPVGRSGSADFHIADTGLAPAFSYSHSRGLFAGVSLDGSVIMARSEVNHCFYGRPVSPTEILSGKVAPPRAAAPLYDALAEAMSSLPDVKHVKRTHDESGRRVSVAASNPNPHPNAGADAGDTTAALLDDDSSHTIREINDLLNSSGYQGSNGSNSVGGTNRDPHRRRTMAHSVHHSHMSSEGVVVEEDEVWGVNSGFSAATEAAAASAHQHELNRSKVTTQHESSFGLGGVNGGQPPGSITQRRARPRSLPETRSDSMAVNYPQRHAIPASSIPVSSEQKNMRSHEAANLLSAEDILGDVPKPDIQHEQESMDEARKEGDCGALSLIDEELECVTANVNILF